MNAKKALTIILLLFVAASLIALVRNEMRRPASATPSPMQASASDPAPKLIAYYLHGKVRCVTCNDIERTAKAAIDDGFGAELQTGRLASRVVNYDELGNEHYTTDFDIAAPCVVLASMRDGRQIAWKSLPEVWELIDDKPAFKEFVQKSVRQQLELESSASAARATPSRPAPKAAATAVACVPGKLPLLVDLGAGKCIPCKMMAPVLETLKKDYQGRLDVVFIDVWEDSASLETYNVSTIPTQIFIDAEGKERFRHEGFFSREEILAKWKELKIDLGDGKKL